MHTQTLTITKTDQVATPDTQTGGHDKFTHIVVEGWHVAPTDSESGGTWIPETPVIDSFVNGTPLVALCGKTWVPNDNPHKYPLCPSCKEIAGGRGWKVPTV